MTALPRCRPVRAGSLIVALLTCAAGCGDGGGAPPANEAVRARIERLAPAANLGHRGTGPTRPLGLWPENSLPAYREAMAQGADGIELDVELTADGELVVMHDDGLDRTTTCAGCVSGHTLAVVRACRLLDGRGRTTEEHPPTLTEAYAALPDDALVNVELKVYGARCLTDTTGAGALARAAVAEVKRLGAGRRTLFSSFEAEALAAVKEADANLYAAWLLFRLEPDTLDRARALGLDAVHPFFSSIRPEEIAAVRAAGLQVTVWTVNGAAFLTGALDAGASGIITDEPGVLAAILAERRSGLRCGDSPSPCDRVRKSRCDPDRRKDCPVFRPHDSVASARYGTASGPAMAFSKRCAAPA